ncbi:hypothetical protein B2A_10080, partial [mine drainage metagenome]
MRGPLRISCSFSDGSRVELTLDARGCPLLGKDLLVGLAELVHPHGRLDGAGTLRHYVQAARRMVASFAARGFTGGARELTRGGLAEYFMGAGTHDEACTRRMLVGFDEAVGGLQASVRELAGGRAFNPQRFRRPLPPYSEATFARLSTACTATIEESFSAHQAALQAAARGEDPRSGGFSEDNLCFLLARSGPSSAAVVGARLGISAQTVYKRGGLGEASRALFPHLDVTVAYVLGF